MMVSFISRGVFNDKHSSWTCLWRLVSPTLTILRTMSRVRLLASGQDCSLMCWRNSQGQQISGKTLELLVRASTRILLVTPSLMIDTAPLMQSVRSNIHLYSPLISFINLSLIHFSPKCCGQWNWFHCAWLLHNWDKIQNCGLYHSFLLTRILFLDQKFKCQYKFI